ncbi:MAG: hypothetical protein K6E33_02595, partial [Lachnospiraceae bacterium]|nr:hypothetical protein [Lachnospiraceae bacterium]
GEVICARNCHKSVFHAIELGRLKAHWIMPERINEYDIYGSLPAERVREAVSMYPESRAVVITSPTYEGVLSDIESIAEICHSHGIPLIVDEAHGAHLGIISNDGQETHSDKGYLFFPKGAVEGKADIVIQSPHKTLSSFTQSAWMHLNGRLVSPEEIERQLGIFETSSPSYPLMASLDRCTGTFLERGDQILEGWLSRLDRFYRSVKDLDPGIFRVFGTEPDTMKGSHAEQGDKDAGRDQRHGYPETLVYRRDPSKILIRSMDRNWTGKRVYDILRDEFGIQCEMSCGMNVLAMTGPGDTDESLQKLTEALCALSVKIQNEREGNLGSGITGYAMDQTVDVRAESIRGCETLKESGNSEEIESFEGYGSPKVTETFKGAESPEGIETSGESVCTIAEALEGSRENVSLSGAAGRVSAEYIWCYPPGIPILVPGEVVSGSHIKRFRSLRDSGTGIYYSFSGDDPEVMSCLVEQNI